ncbi:MAG TPA: molybdopterin-dependent oxidoreductase [Ornithinimicrobium sp.]|uniref:molybdopterin-dependent oxidoreductase n=1 Tax=Ornithinimicrobium sp. TaxID=1977084 RepID=UPI002B4729B2|nr:molybdopterin-dependent oxidoreductase [Ornithinimicrobium sp.]HKJ12301.1 molybdopterin-dependent oxidoreductase [Ornithinimicrobium sp.]
MTMRWASAFAGLAAGSVTLGVAELLTLALRRAGLDSGTPSALLAVGGTVVDLTPAWLKDAAIAAFGTWDKLVLFLVMGVVLALLCAGLGVLTSTRRLMGLLLFAVVGAVGALAVLTRPGAGPLDAAPTIAGTLTGLVTLAWLIARSTSLLEPRTTSDQPGLGRRGFLLAAGALTTAGLVGVYLGRTVGQAQEAVEAARRRLSDRFAGRRPAVMIPDEADLGVDGLEPFLTSNESFYRIDTALSVPQVDPGTWTLRVHGMVSEEITLGFEDLVSEDLVDTTVTLCCVSNEVGGELIGNAVWTGWPIRELLERAGVSPEADMVLSTSEDGWTASTPLEALTDERDAVLAVLMNGEPLPAEHGFPVRMVVPGLYGYVSATKWVTELEVTRFDRDQAYWTSRGWSARGPIKVQSRIDVPGEGAGLQAGPVVVAGMAWAQHVGVDEVEMRVDDGDWQQAELSGEVSIDTWRQWRVVWDATPGSHTLTVRATDQGGQTQVEAEAPPAPDGATGWHSIEVTVA